MGRPALALLAALLLPLRAEVLQWGREVTYNNLGEASDAAALRSCSRTSRASPVEIQLASGEHKIRATLLVHHTWVKIVGNGAGATLDGQGTTRLFDVKGGTLELEGVSLTRGGDVADGAAVQVRRGGRFNLTNGAISESHAVPPVDVSGRETHSRAPARSPRGSCPTTPSSTGSTRSIKRMARTWVIIAPRVTCGMTIRAVSY